MIKGNGMVRDPRFMVTFYHKSQMLETGYWKLDRGCGISEKILNRRRNYPLSSIEHQLLNIFGSK
jgi:hypothetical protein